MQNNQGLSSPVGLAFDQSGNLYVLNGGDGSISKVTPGGVVSTLVTGSQGQFALPPTLLIDKSGNLYVGNGTSDALFSPIENTISMVTPSGAVSTYAHLSGGVRSETIDASGNIYASLYAYPVPDNKVIRVPPGGGNEQFVTGVTGTLASDSVGNLYIGTSNGITKVTPGGVSSTFVQNSQALNNPAALAFDQSGNLYVANQSNNTIIKIDVTVASQVTIRSSLPSRPMFLGGNNNAATAGINLTSAELTRIFTTGSATINIGDSSQTGSITFASVTPATVPGVAINVLQSISGPGPIVLDDGTGTGLDGNGGTVTLQPGSGGVWIALSATNVALATNGFSATGLNLNLTLNFAPTLGANYRVINNTGSGPINGSFNGLPQGGTITASYLGTPYTFIANYLGGDGNDLVLTASASTPAATTMKVSSLPGGTVVYGTPMFLTATVSPVGGSAAPTLGSVEFMDGALDLGPGVDPAISGNNLLFTKILTANQLQVIQTNGGTHTITAVYSPGSGFNGSTGTLSGGVKVTPAPLTIMAVTNTKTYDSTTSAAAIPTVSGLKGNDTVTGLAEVYADRNAGSSKALSVSAYTVNDGNGGSNYTVTTVNNTTGVINAAPISSFVSGVVSGPNGFTAAFNKPLNTAALTLYGTNLTTLQDVTLRGSRN